MQVSERGQLVSHKNTCTVQLTLFYTGSTQRLESVLMATFQAAVREIISELKESELIITEQKNELRNGQCL